MIVGGYRFGLAGGTITYLSPVALNDSGPNDSDNVWIAPRAGTCKNLYLNVNVLIGVGEFAVLTFIKNNTWTLLTIQMSTGDPTTVMNITDQINFIAGDRLSLKLELSDGAICPRAFFGMEISLP